MESLESFNQVYDMVCQYCKETLSEVAYSLWVNETRPVKMEGTTAYLQVTTKFKKGIVEEKYVPIFKKAFAHVLGFDVDIVIGSDDEESSAIVSVEEDSVIGGDYDYTFATFIVGSSNKFAHAASVAVAANPANAYNPLFIYGPSGLGKTHLLNAICNEVSITLPHMKTVYVKGDQFTNELIESINKGSTSSFRDKYRYADILLVDDIQFIGGRESTQEEFFHTFNMLHENGKQIILTSDRPPKEIKTLEERLRTRFEWGLIADIQPPDLETRIAIIRRKAELLQLEMPADVAEYIANRLKHNIRQLEGAVKKLKAYHQIGSPPSILVAQTAIKDILNDNQPVPVTIDRIISEVSRTYGVSAQDIRSTKRSAGISSARQISCYIIREITQISLQSIGEEFGGRDHSTIVYACQQVEQKIERDPHYKEMIEDVMKNIRSY
jgi:chromosomal replication initiator protein